MKKIIFIFLSLFLVSCFEPWSGDDCCCACQCVDGSYFDYEFYEPDEDIGFVVFDYQVAFKPEGNKTQEELYLDDDLFKYWMPEKVYFSTESYCYNPPENIKQEELTDLKDISRKETLKSFYFSNLSHIFPFSFIKLLAISPYAVACSPLPSFVWIHPKDEASIPNEEQKYFIRFKIYNELKEVVLEKNHYFNIDNEEYIYWGAGYRRDNPWDRDSSHYFSRIYLPYFTADHSIKVFVVEKSTGKEIKQIAETSMTSFEKVKEFSNARTKNCYVIPR